MSRHMPHPQLAGVQDTPTKSTPEPVRTHMRLVHLARHVRLLHHGVLLRKVFRVRGGQIRDLVALPETAFPELQRRWVRGGFVLFPEGTGEEVLFAVLNGAAVEYLRMVLVGSGYGRWGGEREGTYGRTTALKSRG